MSELVEELLRRNRAHSEASGTSDLPRVPAQRLAIVTCMDARLDVFAALGLRQGDAHVIRNAGGIVTDDVLRSLLISQRLLDTKEVLLIQHTDCGMASLDDAAVRAEVETETGHQVPFSLGSFEDLDSSVLRSVERIRSTPYLPHRDRVLGLVYEVASGMLREVG